MLRIVDRVVARLVPRATAAAGCSSYTYCGPCGAIGKMRVIVRTCCLNEGCGYSYSYCGSC